MTGLALEGGGVRGSYQIGAYYAFLDSNISFDGICGTSIGAFNAAMLVAGQEKELRDFWETADVRKILGFNKLPDNKKAVFKTKLRNLLNIIKNAGIDLNGMRQELTRLIDIDKLYQSKVDYGLVTIRLKDLKPLYLYKEDIKPNLLVEHIVASCYLPIFRHEKIIDDSFYLDGGFYDNSPSAMLIEKGYNKIYVVRINGMGQKPKPTKKAEVIYIEPTRSLGGMLTFDKTKINDNIKMGYYDTMKIINNLDGYKYIFEFKNKAFYDKLINGISSKEVNKIKKFIRCKSNKEIIIKCFEYYLKKTNKTYFEIYNINKLIKEVNSCSEQNYIYEFIKKLNIKEA